MTGDRLIKADGSLDLDAARAALDAASAEASRRAAKLDADHAASHGRTTLRYGRVEARRGYLGRSVCLDCYNS
jgi:hypothetical protein